MKALMDDYEKILFFRYVDSVWAKRALEHDREYVRTSKLKFADVYEDWFFKLESRNGAFLNELRKELRGADMKIWESAKPTKKEVRYKSRCRGYEFSHCIMAPILKRRVEAHLRRLAFDPEQDFKTLLHAEAPWKSQPM
ncbi:hypothetical protein ACFO4L_05215 [Bacillus daqingensis]|uniref:Uncharacterized protein n=1 Tax=Bacillus daqingensis TaxID=872396 RepID=A0ABV9NSW2_9BACI